MDNLWKMYLRNSGVAGLSRKALDSALSGSFVSVEPYMNHYTHGVTGQASSRDAETLLKLIYLYCVSPRFDAAEYENMLSMVKGTLPTLEALPSHRIEMLSDSLSYGNNPRVLRLDEKLLSRARVQHLEDNYRRLFCNAAGSTALIISDCKPKEILALARKYLGSIPTIGIEPESVLSNVPKFVNGRIFREFTVEQGMPAAEVAQMFHAPMEYNSANYVAMQAVGYILYMRCVDVLREKEGGTYSPMVQGGLSAISDGQATVQMIFQCSPSEVDRMRSAAAGVVESLAVEGPSEEEVGNAVRYIVNDIREKSSSISYRLAMMKEIEMFGHTTSFAYREAMALSPKKVREALAAVLASGNHIEFVVK